MKADRISFTSKINFVDRSVYFNIRKGKYIDFMDFKSSIVKADDFHSENLRTCCGGGVENSDTGECVGFHALDDARRTAPVYEYIEKIFSQIANPNRGLLIGGKRLMGEGLDSMLRFNMFKNEFLKRLSEVSIFEEHAFTDSESHFYHSRLNDMWIISSIFKDYTSATCKYEQVNSLKNLYRAYKKVKIAKGDALYINGNEVSPDLYLH